MDFEYILRVEKTTHRTIDIHRNDRKLPAGLYNSNHFAYDIQTVIDPNQQKS